MAYLLSDRTIEKIKAEIIRRGIESVKVNETRPERIEGALKGFEIAGELKTPEEFEETLARRERMSDHQRRERVDPDAYWAYVMATAQVDWVFKHLCILWQRGGSFSSSALMNLEQIIRDKGQEWMAEASSGQEATGGHGDTAGGDK